ncbi:choline-binding surface protein A [Streptococcus pneumoniae]|uniref:RICH domain-containing protein n=1 Tax=Streptococcus pneumoniae TaxID=1313 RepID=UPI0005DB4A3C|nr:RICH domain-containing protein [Streptococcus pneumoniae]CMX87811.1 choline-binding surface protein A [Streptococcus pneumoniae]
MFASKSERKVHYSIRKFSIGVASVVVASLFLGGVVHAEEVRRGNNLTVTSSGDEVESHYQSILEKVRKSLEKDRHTQNVDLIKKLQDIKRTYLYKLDNSTKETPKPRVRRNSPEIKAKGRVKNYKEANIELSKYMTDLYKLDNSTKETPKSRVRRNSPQVGDSRELKETIDKAKETLSTYMVTRLTKLDPSVFWFADLLMDAKKVVEEYKTKLEDASDKKSVEDLRKEAEGKIESLIVTHQNREKENQPAPQPGGQAGGSMVVPPVTQTPPSTSQSPGQKATEAEKKKLQDLIRQFQEALNKLDDETKTVPDGAKLT